MLQRGRLPDFDLGGAAPYNPLSHDNQPGDALNASQRQLQLGHLLSALEDPDASLYAAPSAAPGRKDELLPCQCRGDVLGGLRSGDEDEVQSALEVVRLQRAANGGGDLEGRLAEREGCEGDGSGGDESNSLKQSVQFHPADTLILGCCRAHSERRKDFGLADDGCSDFLAVSLHFLALGYWASSCSVVHFGARHGQQFDVAIVRWTGAGSAMRRALGNFFCGD